MEYKPGPETMKVIRAALREAGLEDEALVDAFDHEIARLVTVGETDRPFIKWVASAVEAKAARDLTRSTLQKMFTATCLRHYALRDSRQSSDPDVVGGLPYCQVFSFACAVDGHSEMDLFTARAEDPVWTKLKLPLTWDCKCSIISLLDEEVEEKAVADVPGTLRLPAKVLEQIRRSPWA